MRRSMAYYVAEAKRSLGDPRMSDRALGEAFGYSAQLIQRAKSDSCTDPLAIKLAETIGEDPGEVLLVARAERERDEVVKEHLLRYAGKALSWRKRSLALLSRGQPRVHRLGLSRA